MSRWAYRLGPMGWLTYLSGLHQEEGRMGGYISKGGEGREVRATSVPKPEEDGILGVEGDYQCSKADVEGRTTVATQLLGKGEDVELKEDFLLLAKTVYYKVPQQV